MGPSGKSSGGLQAAINVTPLVDVVLVLLIIFMVVTPMLSQSDQVALPKAVLAQAAANTESSVVLTIDQREQLHVRGETIQEENLVEQLRKAGRANKPRVLLKADASVSVVTVRRLLRRMKTAGIDQVAFAVAEAKVTP